MLISSYKWLCNNDIIEIFFIPITHEVNDSSNFDQGVSVVQVAANENLKTEEKTSR